MDYEDLSVDELQKQIDEIDQSRADLEQALEHRQQQAMYDLAQQIKDLISEHGFDQSEIIDLLGTRKRRVSTKKSNRQYARYADPDNENNVYVRGVIPGWMKQKMLDQGYDSSSKADREAFKANCLTTLED